MPAVPTIGVLQVIIQAGALGLLAYWMIWDRPRERAEQRSERERIDAERIQERDKHDQQLEKLTESFRQECREQREACDRHLERILHQGDG